MLECIQFPSVSGLANHTCCLTNNSTTFNIIRYNICSISKYWDEFIIAISSFLSLTIILLSEVNTGSNFLELFEVDGFYQVSKLRINRSDGGIIHYFREDA